MGNLHHASRQDLPHDAMCVILDLTVFHVGPQEQHDPTNIPTTA